MNLIIKNMNSTPNLPNNSDQSYTIIAYNKPESKSNIYQIVGLSFLTVAMMITSYIVFNNFITAVTLLLCSVALFLFFLQKSVPVVVNYNDRYIQINGEIITWEKIKAWDMIEYQDLTEIDIITTKIVNTYVTFYIKKSNFHDYNRFLDSMYQNADFQKDLAYSNNFQNFLNSDKVFNI